MTGHPLSISFKLEQFPNIRFNLLHTGCLHVIPTNGMKIFKHHISFPHFSRLLPHCINKPEAPLRVGLSMHYHMNHIHDPSPHTVGVGSPPAEVMQGDTAYGDTFSATISLNCRGICMHTTFIRELYCSIKLDRVKYWALTAAVSSE